MRLPFLVAAALVAGGTVASPLVAQSNCSAGSLLSYLSLASSAGSCQIAGVAIRPQSAFAFGISYSDILLTPTSRAAAGGVWVGFDITGPFSAFRDEPGALIQRDGGIRFSVEGSRLGGSSIGPLRDRVVRMTATSNGSGSSQALALASQGFSLKGGDAYPRFDGTRLVSIQPGNYTDVNFTSATVRTGPLTTAEIFRTETTTDVFYDPNFGDFDWTLAFGAFANLAAPGVSEASFSGVSMEMFIATVPEPASLALTGFGLFGLMLIGVRSRQNSRVNTD